MARMLPLIVAALDEAIGRFSGHHTFLLPGRASGGSEGVALAYGSRRGSSEGTGSTMRASWRLAIARVPVSSVAVSCDLEWSGFGSRRWPRAGRGALAMFNVASAENRVNVPVRLWRERTKGALNAAVT